MGNSQQDDTKRTDKRDQKRTDRSAGAKQPRRDEPNQPQPKRNVDQPKSNP